MTLRVIDRPTVNYLFINISDFAMDCAREASLHAKSPNGPFCTESLPYPEPVEPPDNEGAITLWNTVYLERATEQMAKSRQFDPALFQHVSPLGWEHINLTGDYTWHTNKRVAKGAFRPLRSPRNPFSSP